MKKLILRIKNFVRRFFVRQANKIFNKSISSSVPRFYILMMDIILVLLAIGVVMLIQTFPNLQKAELAKIAMSSIALFVMFVGGFLITGSYKGLLRYSGFGDVVKVSFLAFCVFFLLCICNYAINNISCLRFLNPYFPSYSNIVLLCMIVLIFLVLFRLLVRRFYNEYLRPNTDMFKTVIYGAGDGGIITYNALNQNTQNQYKIVSFVDDSVDKIGKSINGVKIRKPEAVLNLDNIKKHNISTVIIAMPSLDVEKRKELMNKLLDLDLNVKSIPHIDNFVDSKIDVTQIEDIKIEDLLEREPIKIGNEDIKRELDGKVVLVTGAAGSIGSEICRQVLQYNPKQLVLFDQAESPIYDIQFELNNEEPYKDIKVPKEYIVGNVKDPVKVEEVFKKYKPQIVYHAAAYKHVPLMESFPYEAVLVNVFGTKNVADLAIKYGVEKFVMISTDKAVNPTNVMGATKRIAEIYTQSRKSATKFVTTRFGNVLGSNGSVIPLFKKQLAHGGPLTVTDERIIRYFMTIPEACSLVLEAGSIGEDDDIFVFDMGEPVKIYDLASNLIKLSHKPDVKIEITGLRPGEKLYEELLATTDNTIPTEYEKIMRAKVNKYTEKEVDSEIETLHQIVPTCNDMDIVRQMKKIVPEFKSNNSVYQELDK